MVTSNRRLTTHSQKSCVKLWTLCQDPGSAKEATELQNLIALADGVALKIGVSVLDSGTFSRQRLADNLG